MTFTERPTTADADMHEDAAERAAARRAKAHATPDAEHDAAFRRAGF